MADAIRACEVSRAFSDHIVLEDISLSIEENEVVAVIGENGSGKSTLLKTMTGLLRPTTGFVQMRMEGTDFREVYRNRRKAKRYTGFGSQEPSFYPELTVSENLAYYASLHDLNWSETKDYLTGLCDRLHLTDKIDDYGYQLSGGMKKRLDIACAAVHRPRYLFLDEPSADLDPGLRETVWEVIQWLQEEGATIIFSTHYVEDLYRFTDRIIILKEGTIVDIDTPKALLERHGEAYNVFIRLSSGAEEIADVLSSKVRTVEQDEDIVIATTDKLRTVYDVLAEQNRLEAVLEIDVKNDGLRRLIT